MTEAWAVLWTDEHMKPVGESISSDSLITASGLLRYSSTSSKTIASKGPVPALEGADFRVLLDTVDVKSPLPSCAPRLSEAELNARTRPPEGACSLSKRAIALWRERSSGDRYPMFVSTPVVRNGTHRCARCAEFRKS